MEPPILTAAATAEDDLELGADDFAELLGDQRPQLRIGLRRDLELQLQPLQPDDLHAAARWQLGHDSPVERALDVALGLTLAERPILAAQMR